MSSVGLDMREENGVGTERVDVVETLGDAVKAFGAETMGVYLVDDRVLPPRLGLLSEACPAGTGEHLRRGGESKQASEAEGQKDFGSGNRHVREMLPRVIPHYKSFVVEQQRVGVRNSWQGMAFCVDSVTILSRG